MFLLIKEVVLWDDYKRHSLPCLSAWKIYCLFVLFLFLKGGKSQENGQEMVRAETPERARVHYGDRNTKSITELKKENNNKKNKNRWLDHNKTALMYLWPPWSSSFFSSIRSFQLQILSPSLHISERRVSRRHSPDTKRWSDKMQAIAMKLSELFLQGPTMKKKWNSM